MKIEWNSCLKVIGSVFLLYLGIYYWEPLSNAAGLLLHASFPLLLGGAMAYLVNIMMTIYEQSKWFQAGPLRQPKIRRPVCLVLSYVTLVALVVLVVFLVVPQLVDCAPLLMEKISTAMDRLVALLNQENLLSEEVMSYVETIDWEERANELLKTITTGFGDAFRVVVGTVSSVVGGVATFFIALVFSFYLLMGKERIGNQCERVMRRYLKRPVIQKIEYVLNTANDCFHRYIVGQCTEAVILGVLCAIGMLILQLPYATIIGALVALTALIPIAGAYIGGGVGAFLIMTESPIKAVIFVVFLILLQQFEGNIIYPKVVGSSIGLPGIWVLAAITVGGGIMGIPGMLIGVPIAATLYRLLRDDVNRTAIVRSENG